MEQGKGMVTFIFTASVCVLWPPISSAYWNTESQSGNIHGDGNIHLFFKCVEIASVKPASAGPAQHFKDWVY